VKAELGGATIANGAALSSVIDVTSLQLVGIIIPASWTTANLTFSGSPDNVTFSDVYDDGGTELKATVIAGAYVALRNDFQCALSGLRYLKIRSGTTGTPVNQGGARTLALVTTQRED
jgi:hypothetical protein